jgi:3-dehydroquinate synthase
MVLAARLSVEKGLLPHKDAERLERIIGSYGLPIQPPADISSLLTALRKDKKRQGSRIHFIFLDALGSARVEAVDVADLYRMAKSFR